MNKICCIFLICLCVMACSEGLNSNMPPPVPEEVKPTSIVSGMPFVAFGKMPAALLSQLTTVPTNEWAETNNANQTVNAQTRYLIINTDYVSDINKFVESPLILSAQALNIPIMIGSDKHDIKEEAVISALGGTKFQESELTIIERSNTGFSITPVGNREGYFLPEYLSARLTIPEDEQAQTLPPDAESLDDDMTLFGEDSTSQINSQLKNGRVEGGVSCKGVRRYEDLRSNGFYDKLPFRTMPIYNGQFCAKYTFNGYENARGLSGFTRMKQWTASTKPVGWDRDRTLIIPGMSQITFRSSYVKSEESTKESESEFKVSATVSGGVGVISVSATGYYSKKKGKVTSFNETYTTGQTTYSNSCVYACCSYTAGYNLYQDKIGNKGRLYGNTLVHYKARDLPFLPRLQVKYVYTKNKSIFRMYFSSYTRPYIKLVFDKNNSKCNDRRCNAIKTCSSTKLPK